MRWMEALLERASGDARRLDPSPWTDSGEDTPALCRPRTSP